MNKEIPQKPVAVFDIDGTIYRSNFLVDVVDSLVDREIFPAKIKRKFKDEYKVWKKQRDREPYVAYIDSLVQTYLEYIPGTTVDELEEAVQAVMSDVDQQTYVFGRDLITKYKDTHFLLAISGSPGELIGLYSRHLGMHDYYAAHYEILEGKYTGKARPGHRDKDKTLLAKVEEHNLTLKGSIGMGDTESDIPMLELVDRPIAFNPNKELLEHALRNGWEVVSEHKDTIYHISKGKYQREGNFGHFYSE